MHSFTLYTSTTMSVRFTNKTRQVPEGIEAQKIVGVFAWGSYEKSLEALQEEVQKAIAIKSQYFKDFTVGMYETSPVGAPEGSSYYGLMLLAWVLETPYETKEREKREKRDRSKLEKTERGELARLKAKYELNPKSSK